MEDVFIFSAPFGRTFASFLIDKVRKKKKMGENLPRAIGFSSSFEARGKRGDQNDEDIFYYIQIPIKRGERKFINIVLEEGNRDRCRIRRRSRTKKCFFFLFCYLR